MIVIKQYQCLGYHRYQALFKQAKDGTTIPGPTGDTMQEAKVRGEKYFQNYLKKEQCKS